METNTNPLYQLYYQFHTTCQHTFNLTAHGWQAAIGAKILHAVSIKKAIKCLCVKPTGGGKSLIFNVVATILKGVTICICPLLSLGANQTKKTLALVDTPSPAPVTAFHLDEMKLKSLHKLKRILRDERSNGTAVIIYTSPQALNDVKGNSIVIPFLIRGNLIRLVVLDEIHLVSSFGNTFRKEFGTLPATLFSKLNINCPMLVLTATCTAAIRCDFESLMQLEINQWQWPSPNEMMHRCVSINAQYTTKPFQHVMKTFKSMISNSDSEPDSMSPSNLPTKVIVYSNTRERILNFAGSIKKKMNADKVLREIDIISLVGTLTKQEKAQLIRLFVHGSRKHPDLKLRLLCTTSGVGNAGINCPDVRAVYRFDPRCGTCTNCTQKKSQFEPVSRQGLTKILLDLFISTFEEMVFTMDNAVKHDIKEYKNSQEMIFNTICQKYKPLRIKKVLFQLITFEILTVVYSVRLQKMLFQLARSGDSVFDISINSDDAWLDRY